MFTLFWLDGTTQLIEGVTIAQAMNAAGIGNGALRALDFYANGDVRADYVWDSTKRSWHSKVLLGKITGTYAE